MDKQLHVMFQSEADSLKPDYNQVMMFIRKVIKMIKVVIFVRENCPYCEEVMQKFNDIEVNYFAYDLDKRPEVGKICRKILKEKTNKRSLPVPLTFVSKFQLGNYSETMDAFQTGRIYDLLEGNNTRFEFDLIVIGGGSGGISAAKEAAKLGRSVALFDYVTPTQHGHRWSVGGVCVNVGCVPKKLFHYAASLGDLYEDSVEYGWKLNYFNREKYHKWKSFINNVQMYIKSLNLTYLNFFLKANIYYQNKFAVFIDKHTIDAYDDDYNVVRYTAQNFIIATGVKPYIPNIPGSDLAITSDDIFLLKVRPKKVIIIGDSYIALETAGFLHGLGGDVTILSNSNEFGSSLFGSTMKTYDEDMIKKIKDHLKCIGIKFLYNYNIEGIMLTDVFEFEYKVTLSKMLDDVNPFAVDPTQYSSINEQFSAVLFAIGRRSKVKELKIDRVGVQLNDENLKIITDKNGRSSCHTIYAVGDIVDGQPELTPYAIKSGKTIVNRLYTHHEDLNETEVVPTTIFTPLEYSCVGYSENEAINKFGKENIECFHSNSQPVEWTILAESAKFTYAKVICNKDDKMKIIGLHYIGKNASEVIQGFSLSMKLGATKYDLDKLVGIFPTSAEIFTTMSPKTDS